MVEHSYDFNTIEKKWQRYWREHGIFYVKNDPSKPKFYVLDMFPYPSGAGLHVGHPLGYIASDIFSRYKRMKGFNVLHPIGFDSFGLPAEQYAIETGQHPSKTTAENIEKYKKQLESIGFCFDWSREIRTSDPAYYKWTQWIFLQLFNSWYNKDKDRAETLDTLMEKFTCNGTSGVNAATASNDEFTASQWENMSGYQQQRILSHYRLAYCAYTDVNWCPALGTVLANDEVKDGKSERGGHPIEKRKMRQWSLRITAYSDRLLNGLNDIEWSPSLKEMQRNWIGRSEGAIIQFQIPNSKFQIPVFTTRPDTIFGATFIVLAPEHDIIEHIVTSGQKKEVEQYMDYVKSRSAIDRQQEKKVTGVFTGAYVIHPFTGQKIPVWIAEYVLAGYGAGAIMAVPADDERDRNFAERFNIPVIEIIDKSNFPGSGIEDKVGKMINSGFITGMDVSAAIDKVINKSVEMGIGSRQVNYRLRDAGFSRQRYWGEPFPIVYILPEDGGEEIPFPLNNDELPVELPEVKSYKPTGDGKSPIAANEEWIYLKNGKRRETDTMPGYAGSSWYFLRYMDPHNVNEFAGKDAVSYWQNVDLYIGGTEHAVGHLIYARFWHKFLCDRGYVTTQEPFKKLINQGMIQGRSSIVYRISGTNKFVSKGLKAGYETTSLRVDVSFVEDDILNIGKFMEWRAEFSDAEFILEDGKYICGAEVEKMSKRWHNVVNPDDVIEKYGADCFRMYEMFLGPLEQHKPWDTKGIEGVSRFLKKAWRLFHDNEGNISLLDEPLSEAEQRVIHKAIKKTEENIARCSFNTGVSTLMIFVNELTDLGCNKREALEKLLLLLSPYAPHIAEELWEKFGHSQSISNEKFPDFDEQYIATDSFEYPVAINGKLRFKLQLPLDISEDEIRQRVLACEESVKWIDNKQPKRVVVVIKKIVNIVV